MKTYNRKSDTKTWFPFQLVIDGKLKKFLVPPVQNLKPKLAMEFLELAKNLGDNLDVDNLDMETTAKLIQVFTKIFAHYAGMTPDEFSDLFDDFEQIGELGSDWQNHQRNTVSVGE